MIVGALVRGLGAGLSAAWLVLGCGSAASRPVDARDRVLGKYPASEVLLRFKRPCRVAAEGGGDYRLPAGDYPPVAADAGGVFFEPPLVVELQREAGSVWLFGVGVYLPSGAVSARAPRIWVEGVGMERGSLVRNKLAPLPEECWRPRGAAMEIVPRGPEDSGP